MTDKELIESIRVIDDFPVKGIHFQDITTLLNNPRCIAEMLDRLYSRYKDEGITKVVGLESRGFILGGALAVKLGAGFVPARKPGKLPGEKVSQTYRLEYGTDTIEMHTGAIGPDDVVLIHDDLLATGGTLGAAYNLVSKFNPKKIHICTMIELAGVPKRPGYPENLDVYPVLRIEVDE